MLFVNFNLTEALPTGGAADGRKELTTALPRIMMVPLKTAYCSNFCGTCATSPETRKLVRLNKGTG